MLSLATLALAQPVFLEEAFIQSEFKSFLTTYNKVYSPEEYSQRYSTFGKNLHYMHSVNAQGLSYTLGVNQFADMDNAEYRRVMLGMKFDATRPQTNIADFSDIHAIPDAVDWRPKGVVTPVKNQGSCGSCWSFSATGNIEGQHALSGKPLVGLSEQNLVDCSTSYGNQGCNGGLMDDAFKYVIDNKGIDTEESYPYTATGPNACKFNNATVGATISSYKDVESKNETALAVAVAEWGPISIGIDASAPSFQMYSSGVYWSYECSSTSLDHGVLAVGYGAKGGDYSYDYWIVKNSWASTWGDSGYIMMIRNWENDCGVSTAPSSSFV